MFGKYEIIGIFTNILSKSIVDIFQDHGYDYIINPCLTKHPDIIKRTQPDIGIEIKISANKFRISAHHRYNTNILYGKLIIQQNQPIHFQGLFFTDKLTELDWYSLNPIKNTNNIAKSYTTNLNHNRNPKIIIWIYILCQKYIFM